ncbi:MAG: DUF4252 domain-containing protein [Tannerellaceae bacterium]|jgi:hypothetical protein|nr:DUF4252 domain-containing protein [Tannerellaceae bacterium]
MKKVISILIVFFIWQTGYSQTNVKQLYNDFSNVNNAKRIKIGKFMMSIVSLLGEPTGVNSIEILEFSDCENSEKERFDKAIRNLKDADYETMINTNKEGERVKVMIRIKNEIIHELVVLSSGHDAAMIRIKGKIKKSEIERLVNDHS